MAGDRFDIAAAQQEAREYIKSQDSGTNVGYYVASLLDDACTEISRLTEENRRLRRQLDGAAQLSDDAAELQARTIEAILRLGKPWSTREIIVTLTEAAAHLLRTPHDCDCLGWERFQRAEEAAQEWLREYAPVSLVAEAHRAALKGHDDE